MAVEKLKDQFSLAYNDLNCLWGEQEYALAKLQHFCAKESCILNACLSAHAQLTCLKKVHKRIHSKKYYLIEQNLYKLETEEVKTAKTSSIPTVVETAYTQVVESLTSTAYLLPLADLFFF